jgi:ubiquinone/menaquinone biosynthesis C-methylase UbiE
VLRYLSESLIGSTFLGRRPSESERLQMPNPLMVLKDLKELIDQDARNIEEGVYKAPPLIWESPVSFLSNTFTSFRDLLNVKKREESHSVKEFSSNVPKDRFPSYYAQAFHFQTDGYLSGESAELYDHQVELVFAGGAEAMRRQALPPLVNFFRGQSTANLKLLDVACGTGRFLSEVKMNFPDLQVVGLDLSPWYLKKARETLAGFTRADFCEANAEEIPFKENHFDALTCIYLFHELPRRVRSQVVHEMSRVLKPGGLMVHVDTIQLGDKPHFDGSLKHFPKHFHEPYYQDYIEQDLNELMSEGSFEKISTDLAFFSKITVWKKVSKPQ